jgi:hypothetical protein
LRKQVKRQIFVIPQKEGKVGETVVDAGVQAFHLSFKKLTLTNSPLTRKTFRAIHQALISHDVF